MADSKLSALATLATSAIATGDLVPIVDVSDTSMAGSGTNKVFDANKIFLTDVAQTLTAATTMAPATTGITALTVNMPTGTAATAINMQYNSTSAIWFNVRATLEQLWFQSRDLGNDTAGPGLEIGRNASTGAVGTAPAVIRMYAAGNLARSIWVDDSGNLRIGSLSPTGNTGTPTIDANGAGVVVGTQTSYLDAKQITGDVQKIDDVLVYIRQGAKAVQRFRYKSRAYNNHEFEGIVIDDAPRYGMDVDKEHPNGKSLNVATALGDLMRAVAYLADRVETLEAEVATLQAG
jgi:hypothetical protein